MTKQKEFNDWHLYIGAYAYGEFEENKFEVCRFDGLYKGDLYFTGDGGSTEWGDDFYLSTKLILRPISSITDEELVEIMTSPATYQFNYVIKERSNIGITGCYYVGSKKIGNIGKTNYDQIVNDPQKIIKALELKIDLFDLISTGQALDSTDKKLFPVDPYSKEVEK